MIKLHWKSQPREDLRDDFVFLRFGVLDDDGIVILHEKFTVALCPYLKHPIVDDVGFRGLRIVSNSLSNCFIAIASSPKLSSAPCN